MGDLFNEFMRELERRRAEAEGRTPPGEPGKDEDRDADDAADPEGDADGADDDGAERRARAGRAPDEAERAKEPTPIRGRRPGGSRSGRPPGGSGSGGGRSTPGGPN